MNKIFNKFLLARDKFVPELNVRPPGFTYSASGLFTKHRVRIQKCKDKSDLKHVYKNQLDKACFAYYAEYSTSKDLAKRTISNMIWKDKAYEIATYPKYDGYQREIASIVYNSFNKKTRSEPSINEKLV